jgi:hypothetical protein
MIPFRRQGLDHLTTLLQGTQETLTLIFQAGDGILEGPEIDLLAREKCLEFRRGRWAGSFDGMGLFVNLGWLFVGLFKGRGLTTNTIFDLSKPEVLDPILLII